MTADAMCLQTTPEAETVAQNCMGATAARARLVTTQAVLWCGEHHLGSDRFRQSNCSGAAYNNKAAGLQPLPPCRSAQPRPSALLATIQMAPACPHSRTRPNPLQNHRILLNHRPTAWPRDCMHQCTKSDPDRCRRAASTYTPHRESPASKQVKRAAARASREAGSNAQNSAIFSASSGLKLFANFASEPSAPSPV